MTMDTKMDHITQRDTVVCFDAETIHGDYTEFVLDRATDRTDTDYYNALERILDKDLVLYGSVREVDCYYKVNVSVQVPNMKDIPRVLEICNKSVAKWIAQYNINGMIRHECQEYNA